MNINATVFVPATIKSASPPESGASSGASGSNTSSSPGSGTDHAFHLLQANQYVEKSPHQRSNRGNLRGTANARSHNPSPRGTNGPQLRGSRSSQRRNNTPGASTATFPLGTQHDDEYAASIQHTEINNQGDVNSDETQESSFVEASQLTPNKRGQISLNHLLNFSFPERQRPTSEFRQPARKKANYVPYDRERFVNANFRFLVKAIRDFTVYLSYPDFVIEWSDIDQVLITTTNPPSCPICLQLPMSARVTKCGHTFCLSCILHYLALSEDKKTWRKCPICWDSVYAKDLKSVRFWEVASVKPSGEESPASFSEGNITDGQMLEFRLMRREVDSMLVFPESAYWPQRRGHVSVPWHFTPDAMTFAKFMMSTPDYMTNELQHDMDQLMTSLEEARNWNEEAEIPFLEMAIGRVEEEIKVVLREGAENAVSEGERKAREQIAKAEMAAEKREQERAEKMDEMAIAGKEPESLKHSYAGASEGNTSQPSTTTTTTLASRISAQSSKGGDSSYFFYQSHDGQNIYLHPLDIRILKHEFGSYADFPRTLISPIVAISESTVTADLRKRFKYLSHLPLSCDVTFVELELSGIVGETTMCTFSNELRSRISKREEKVRKEEKARLEAEERERRELESATGGEQARLARLEKELILREDPFFQVSVSPSSPFDVDDVISHGDFSSESDERDHRFSEGSVGSGDNNNHDVPAASLSEPPRESTSSSKKTVWGTPSVSFANVAANKQKPNSWGGKWSTFHDHDLEDEDYDDWGEAHEVVNKKGKKKLVLMSTGGRRGG